MDTETDFLEDMQKLDNLTEGEFFEWLKFVEIDNIPKWFLDNVWAMQDCRVIELLKEKYWDEFVKSKGRDID